MRKMRIMVCKYGYAVVDAETEAEAIEKAKNMEDNEYDWSDSDDAQVVEVVDKKGEIMDKKLFKKSMEIGALFDSKYKNDERTDWIASEECAEFCRYIIEEAVATNQPVKDIFCQSGEHFIEIINNNGSGIKSHGWDEYCKGFLAGEILGMPTKENMKLVTEAEKLWEDPKYRYYQEVLEEVKKNSKRFSFEWGFSGIRSYL